MGRKSITVSQEAFDEFTQIATDKKLSQTDTMRTIIRESKRPLVQGETDILKHFEDLEKNITSKVEGAIQHFEQVIQHDVVNTFDHLRDCKPCIDKVKACGFQVAYSPKNDQRGAP